MLHLIYSSSKIRSDKIQKLSFDRKTDDESDLVKTLNPHVNFELNALYKCNYYCDDTWMSCRDLGLRKFLMFTPNTIFLDGSVCVGKTTFLSDSQNVRDYLLYHILMLFLLIVSMICNRFIL